MDEKKKHAGKIWGIGKPFAEGCRCPACGVSHYHTARIFLLLLPSLHSARRPQDSSNSRNNEQVHHSPVFPS